MGSRFLGLLLLSRCYLCQRTNHWVSLLCSNWATLGLPLPRSKSMHFVAIGLLGLPCAYLCQRAHHRVSPLWGYWGYLGPTFTSEPIIGLNCSGVTVTTLGLPSLDQIALGLLELPCAYLCNPKPLNLSRFETTEFE